MGIYLIFGKFGKKCGVGQLPLSGALKPPVRQLRNGFSNSAQNLDKETIFKPFGLDGWLKVSYLLDYNYLLLSYYQHVVFLPIVIIHYLYFLLVY